ncbi:MAG: guanylate kinase [Bacteriovoracia bacterium]
MAISTASAPLPKLIILSAPSAAGKTTLCQRLLEDFGGRIVSSISCTTRAPRPGEKSGREYFFLNEDEFNARERAGEFVETALVHGKMYGTSRRTVEDLLDQGKSVLLAIDIQGADSLKLAFPGRCITVFINPPSMEILEKRLRARGTESDQSIETRIQNARDEMKHAHRFDHVIVNDELDRAYTELLGIVEKGLGIRRG